MSDPRNVAHAKKITQEKKHDAADRTPDNALAAQRGKKPAAAKEKRDPAGVAAMIDDTPTAPSETSDASPAPTPSATLERSLVVLNKLQELEFHSRAHLERLAELTMTVEDELKQKEIVSPLAEVYAAQSAFQTKLTALIEVYKTECDRMQGGELGLERALRRVNLGERGHDVLLLQLVLDRHRHLRQPLETRARMELQLLELREDDERAF